MKSLSICVLYGATAVCYNLISKYLMSSLHLPPFFFLSCQSFLVVLFTLAFKKSLTLTQYASLLPMTLFNFGNLAFGLVGMNFVSLPMYVCIRKLTTLVVFCVDFKFDNALSTLGVVLITCGGLIAGAYDSTGSFAGYGIVFCSVLMNAGQLVYAKELNKKGFEADSVYFYSTCIGFPLACFASFLWEFEELGSVLNFGAGLLGVGCCSSILASLMTVVCSGKVSPIATSVTGNFKDAFSMVLGLVIFQEKHNRLFLYGLVVSTLGAIVYSYSKLKPLHQKPT